MCRRRYRGTIFGPNKIQNQERNGFVEMPLKRRQHIQFVKRFGVLFSPNIVPLESKKFGKIFDPNIFSFIKGQHLALIKIQIV